MLQPLLTRLLQGSFASKHIQFAVAGSSPNRRLILPEILPSIYQSSPQVQTALAHLSFFESQPDNVLAHPQTDEFSHWWQQVRLPAPLRPTSPTIGVPQELPMSNQTSPTRGSGPGPSTRQLSKRKAADSPTDESHKPPDADGNQPLSPTSQRN